MRFEILLIVICASLSGLAQPLEQDSLTVAVDVDIEFVKVYNGQDHVAMRVYEKGLPSMPVEDVLCNLHLTSISPIGMQGSLITDENGEAIFPLVGKFKEAQKTLDEYIFICRIANDERFIPIDKERRFKKSRLDVSFGDDNVIRGQLSRLLPDSSLVPVQEAEITVYIEQDGQFELHDLGSHRTDRSGRFSLQVDQHLPGDSLGMIQLMVQAKHPEQGTIQYLSAQAWGMLPGEYADYEHRQHMKYRTIALLLIIGIVFIYVFRRRIFNSLLFRK